MSSGLALAARCKALGMDCLIIEQSADIGDIWKKRYEYLSLHFPHWPDDLPYFAYPKKWPTFTPAQKQGIYMGWYASALELNVWCKSTISHVEQDDKGNWTVVIDKEGREALETIRKQRPFGKTLLSQCSPRLPLIPARRALPEYAKWDQEGFQDGRRHLIKIALHETPLKPHNGNPGFSASRNSILKQCINAFQARTIGGAPKGWGQEVVLKVDDYECCLFGIDGDL